MYSSDHGMAVSLAYWVSIHTVVYTALTPYQTKQSDCARLLSYYHCIES